MTSSARAGGTRREQSRARYPDRTGVVERDGVRVFWEEYGRGEPTIMFVPGFSISPSRLWKSQLPYFARHARVLTFDGRGNGRSDRPLDLGAYTDEQIAEDVIGVLDATGTDRAVLVGLSAGVQWSLLAAMLHPDRVARLCLVGPGVGGKTLPTPAVYASSMDEPRHVYAGWGKFNSHYMRQDLRGFAEWFMGEVFPEPHSTKHIQDGVDWALDTTPEVLRAAVPQAPEAVLARLDQPLPCPALVVVGSDDRVTPPAIAVELAERTGAPLLVMEGSGHNPAARHPVRFNLVLKQFALPEPPTRSTWSRALSRRRRALFISSPIGLGHAWRDIAIARALRELVPDLQIDWLAQDPVTRVLQAEGERIHPASAELASEIDHIDSESGDHELPVFDAYRRMDEILLANFMVFNDLVQDERYDVWIADEAWEIDHLLHENPECKSAAYVWLTDFVGFLPFPEGGEREAFLTADLNAEMLEHVARFPRVRDRAIFVGEPDDIVPGHFGPGLPAIRPWIEEHFAFAGYAAPDRAGSDRAAMRAELGWADDERVCVVTAGGSGTGTALLRRAIESHAAAAERVPGLRMVVVAGPRIAMDALPDAAGVEVVGYVHDLRRLLVASDVAVVHGGLASTMELAAARRPFLYFPLKRHFEQCYHVHHRLQRHGAGRRMDIDDAGPGVLAAAIADELDRPVTYPTVDVGGAARAAGLIAELL